MSETKLSGNARKVRDYFLAHPLVNDVTALGDGCGVHGWELVDAIVELSKHKDAFGAFRPVLKGGASPA